MSYTPNTDFRLEVARGNIAGVSAVTKYGRNGDVDLAAAEDVWDGGGTWVAPTTARTHDIASSSASDAAAGVGARTVRVWGLTAWNAAEVSEDITMNGVTNVPTVNSYVIIHRIRVLTKGATNTNVGTITATAQTDATITAQIDPGIGSTLMAIYGVPSTQTFFMTEFEASIVRDQGGAGLDVQVDVVDNPEPDVELLNFRTRHTNALQLDGGSSVTHPFNPYKSFPGPCIIKLRATASANDAIVSGGFDGFLVTN